MASRQSTVDFIVEQAGGAGRVRARKMFGEYGLYCDDRLVALVCDDQLYVKPSAAGRAHVGEAAVGEVAERPPYAGAKPCLVIAGDRWEDGAWLAELFRLSAEALPAPAKRPSRPGAAGSTRGLGVSARGRRPAR